MRGKSEEKTKHETELEKLEAKYQEKIEQVKHLPMLCNAWLVSRKGLIERSKKRDELTFEWKNIEVRNVNEYSDLFLQEMEIKKQKLALTKEIGDYERQNHEIKTQLLNIIPLGSKFFYQNYEFRNFMGHKRNELIVKNLDTGIEL